MHQQIIRTNTEAEHLSNSWSCKRQKHENQVSAAAGERKTFIHMGIPTNTPKTRWGYSGMPVLSSEMASLVLEFDDPFYSMSTTTLTGE